MAVTDLLQRSMALERVDDIESDATVRHVDQLDPATLAAFYEAVTSGGSIPVEEADLEEGEIIVFTDYYRVTDA